MSLPFPLHAVANLAARSCNDGIRRAWRQCVQTKVGQRNQSIPMTPQRPDPSNCAAASCCGSCCGSGRWCAPHPATAPTASGGSSGSCSGCGCWELGNVEGNDVATVVSAAEKAPGAALETSCRRAQTVPAPQYDPTIMDSKRWMTMAG